MLRRCSVLVATLCLIAAALWADSPGTRELGLGKEALVHRDFRAAAEHLTAATQTLDSQAEKESLADAWLQLGVVDLTGLDHAADALAAFRKSADLAASPSSAWLWAATAAEKLGHADEAAELKARALAPPPPVPEPPPAPETVQAKVSEPSPEPVKAAPAPAVPPDKEKAPAAAPAETAKTANPPKPTTPAPSAFQHFFGPKQHKAPPAPPPKPAAASPTAPPPVKEGAAFQHLFGENRPDRPAGAREAQAEGAEARKAKEEKAKAAAGASPHRDTLEILFGEKKKEVKKGDAKAPEPKQDDGTP